MQFLLKFFLLALPLNFTNSSVQARLKFPQKMCINFPVVDLRNGPEEATNIDLPTSGKTNPQQASQLLLSENIVAISEQIEADGKKWLKIKALQQDRYVADIGWGGFPGWIQEKQAIKIKKYPKYNLVIQSLTPSLLDSYGNKLDTLSIGTRLLGKPCKKSSQWYVTFPNGKSAFIDSKAVYLVDKQVQESEEELRKKLVQTAKKFMGNLYSWGGRSPQNSEWTVSSVDCSSFVNLVFLAQGFQIPRNAHDQYLKTDPIDHGKDLKAGDLVFFCSETLINKSMPIRMNHVLMYIGDGKLIESSRSGNCAVQIISFQDRIGVAQDQMKSGDKSIGATSAGVVGNQYYIYFGSYIKNRTKTQEIRDRFFAV